MVALAHHDIKTARRMLQEALADPINLYPYTHVQGLLGLARIAAHEGDQATCRSQLQRALAFAGNRSLIEEYVDVVLEIARLDPEKRPRSNCYAMLMPTRQRPA